MNSLSQLRSSPFILIHKKQEEIEADPALLDGPESARYHRFLDPKKKEEFLKGRCLIKTALAELLGISPGLITVFLSEKGKPFVQQDGQDQVHFNLSHTGGHFVLALALNPVGVDLELKRERNPENLITFFTKSEMEALMAMTEQERKIQTLVLFTAKEAFIKCTDKAFGLDEICFVFSSGFWKLTSPESMCEITIREHDEFIIAVSWCSVHL